MLCFQALQIAVAALPMLLQGALLLVTAATVTTLVWLPYSWGGNWREIGRAALLLKKLKTQVHQTLVAKPHHVPMY